MQISLVLIVELADRVGCRPVEQLLTPGQLLTGEIDASEGHGRDPRDDQPVAGREETLEQQHAEHRADDRGERCGEFDQTYLADDPVTIEVGTDYLGGDDYQHQQWREPQTQPGGQDGLRPLVIHAQAPVTNFTMPCQ